MRGFSYFLPRQHVESTCVLIKPGQWEKLKFNHQSKINLQNQQALWIRKFGVLMFVFSFLSCLRNYVLEKNSQMTFFSGFCKIYEISGFHDFLLHPNLCFSHQQPQKKVAFLPKLPEKKNQGLIFMRDPFWGNQKSSKSMVFFRYFP